MECPIAQTLEVVGERWALLVVRDAFLGVRRFDDFQRRLGIASNILSARLDSLVAGGVMERRLYRDNPPRHEYRLTEKGRDLQPVLLAMARWGDRWGHGGPPPVELTHSCGSRTRGLLVCSQCGEPLTVRNLTASGRGVPEPAPAPA
jgi:DNA-binding HxlR family transcriptional regulator